MNSLTDLDRLKLGMLDVNVVQGWIDNGGGGGSGPAGPEGPVGPQGPQGPEGPQGPQGPEGPQGPVGPAGDDGMAGADGVDGSDGMAGADGVDGTDGSGVVLNVYNHVDTSVLYPPASDIHIDLLDTSFNTFKVNQDVLIQVAITYEPSTHDGVFYMKVDGVEVGSHTGSGGATRGISPFISDQDNGSTPTSGFFQYRATIPGIGTHVVTIHGRASFNPLTLAVNRTIAGTETAATELGASSVSITYVEDAAGPGWIGSQPTFGDIKSGLQSADHNGWVVLDGRAVSTLTANQQAVASSLGFSANLPDATDKYLSQTVGTLGDSVGSNSRTIQNRVVSAWNHGDTNVGVMWKVDNVEVGPLNVTPSTLIVNMFLYLGVA